MTERLTRRQISEFIGTDRGVRAFEGLQTDVSDQIANVTNATFLTLGQEPSLGSERVFGPVSGELEANDGGANGIYSLGLADTGVSAGVYGDAGFYPSVRVDAKGRIVDVEMVALPSSPVGTVASLPSAASSGAGARGFVTDATATTFLSIVAGGGANKVPVVSDGANWLIG